MESRREGQRLEPIEDNGFRGRLRSTLIESSLPRCRFERRGGRTARAHRADSFASPRFARLFKRRPWMRRTLPPPRAAEFRTSAAPFGATRRWWPSRASTSASNDDSIHRIRAIFSTQTGAAAALHTGHPHGSCAARQRQYRAPQPPQRVSGPLHAAVACRRASFRVLSVYGSI